MIPFRKDSHYCTSGSVEQLHSLLDGELPEAGRSALAAHLERCSTCAAALQRLTESDRRLAAARPSPPPLSPAASRALLDRALAEAGTGRRGFGGGWLPLAWGAAAGLAILVSGAGLAWWGPARTAHDPRADTRLAAVPKSAPRDAPAMTIDSSPGPRTTEIGPPAPRVSEPPHRSLPPTLQHPSKLEVRPSAPAPLAGRRGRTPTHRTRLGLHRFIAEAPSQTEPSLPLVPREPDVTPAPATGEQIAENTPLEQRLAAPLAGSGPQRADAGEPPAQKSTPLPDQAPGVVTATVADGAAGQGSERLAASQGVTDPESSGSTGTPGGAEAGLATQMAAPLPPRLLVLVASTPAPSPVAVTRAPEGAPSYARAVALKPDVNGLLTWTQATASDDGTGQKLALVMLGSNPWPWIEEE